MAPVVLAVDDEVVVAAHPVHLLHVQVDVVPLDGAVFATMIIDSQNLFDYIYSRLCEILTRIRSGRASSASES